MNQTQEMFPDDLNEEAQLEILYQSAISQPLEVKIKKAIMLIQTFENSALQKNPSGFYVAFSGGKDSIVLAKLFEMSGVKFQLHYNNTTIDAPELYRFMRKEYPQVIWHNVAKSLPIMMTENGYGPPTRLKRWCCALYKEHGGEGSIRSTGVRASESPRRKGLWREVSVDRCTKDPILCPILYWTDDDIWNFIKENNISYCSLYDEGFKRLGCVGCPMADKQRKKHFERWPRYERLWKRGFQAYWDKYRGLPKKNGEPRWIEKLKDVDEFWAWWMEEKNVNDTDEADCQMWLW